MSTDLPDRYAVISDTDNSWDGVVHADKPDDADGFHIVTVPFNYTDGSSVVRWSAQYDGWEDIPPPVLITVGRFKLLMTQAERIAIRAAAAASPSVEDFLDLLNGFTDGVSLSDPLLTAALAQMQAAGLLTADRVTAILAGETP